MSSGSVQLGGMHLAPGEGLDQRINHNMGLWGPCHQSNPDMLKSFGLLYPFVESQISCVLLSGDGINTQFSRMFAVCSLSSIPFWDTQTTEFLLVELLLKFTDPLQAEDFGCPVKPSLHVGQWALLQWEPFILCKCCKNIEGCKAGALIQACFAANSFATNIHEHKIVMHISQVTEQWL